MDILVNNRPVSLCDGATISQLLKTLDIIVRGVAVAVDDTIIPKIQWNNYRLVPQNNVTVIQATAGG